MDYILIANAGFFAARLIIRFLIVYICFIIFPDNIQRSKRRIYAQTGIYIIIYTSIQSLFYEITYSLYGIYNPEHFNALIFVINNIFYILYFIPVFMYFRKIISVDFYKLFFVFCMTAGYAYIPNSIQTYTGILYRNLQMSHEAFVISRNIIYLLICFISSVLIGWFFKRFITSHLKVTATEDIKKICVIPGMFLIIIWLNEGFYYTDIVAESIRGFFIFLLLLLTVLSAYIYLMIFQMQSITRKSKKAGFQLEQNREYNKMLGKRYLVFQAHIIKTRQAEHDLRHHFSVLKSYISSGDNNKLNLYLDEYINSLPSGSSAFYPLSDNNQNEEKES